MKNGMPDCAAYAGSEESIKTHGLQPWHKDASQYSWEYDVAELGYKYHTNDINSAIGLVQLKRLPETNARRLDCTPVQRRPA